MGGLCLPDQLQSAYLSTGDPLATTNGEIVSAPPASR
jgi:hypothetical protein